MGKNTELKLVGQPILSQVLKLIDQGDFNSLSGGQRVTGIIRPSRTGIIWIQFYLALRAGVIA